MATLKIVKFGDPMLRKVSKPVVEIGDRINTLIDDMIETMRAEDGCGLAGVQVGVLRRLFVIEAEPGEVYVFINPEILETSGEQDEPEGCLSNPGEYGMVKRPMFVKAKATDRNGKEFTVKAEGLFARAIMHEYDHLEGKIYTDLQYRVATEKDFRKKK